MNYRLVCRLLGLIALLISCAMLFSLPWAWPSLGVRGALPEDPSAAWEGRGFWALVQSFLISAGLGVVLFMFGRRARGALFHKEAMAVVGLTWVLATVLGGLPYWFCEVGVGPMVRWAEDGKSVFVYQPSWLAPQWVEKRLERADRAPVRMVTDDSLPTLPISRFTEATKESIRRVRESDADMHRVIQLVDEPAPWYRMRWRTMTICDALFESQSGFSTTGATVLSELEDPQIVPHCILFWRSSTHFLGGLGIIVLFVAVLGQGSAGKALMRNEVPGPSQEGSQARVQHTAWVFAGMYVGLTAVLAILLKLCGLTWFDALCHAFGTMATGGFSTYNASLGHFDSSLIDALVMLFMLMAGMNFTLLYFLLLGQLSKLWHDAEWRCYLGIIGLATLLIVIRGHWLGELADRAGDSSLATSVRFGLFQIISVITTTGFGTHDFDAWNSLSRCILVLLMFVGGCAGSTGGGIKVIRWLMLSKVLGLELERAYHPRVVRPLRVGGKVVRDEDLRNNLLVYFCVIGTLFLASWFCLLAFESDATWAGNAENKMMDAATAVAATLNNIGPGLGTVGPTRNFGHFGDASKLLFTWLMVLGRVEVFAILVLLSPRFWQQR